MTLTQSFVSLFDYSGNTSDERIIYFSKIVQPLKSAFTSLINRPNFHQIAFDPQIFETVNALIVRFRGLVRASISNEDIIFLTTSEYFPIFNRLIITYQHSPSILINVLKFYHDLCENQIENLSPEHASFLFNAIVDLIGHYSAYLSTHPQQQNTPLLEQEEQEESKALNLIIKLLSVMAGNPSLKSIKNLIFLGLSHILPHISQTLLQVTEVIINSWNQFWFKIVSKILYLILSITWCFVCRISKSNCRPSATIV